MPLLSNKNKLVFALPLLFMSICFLVDVAYSKGEDSQNLHQAFSNLIETVAKEDRYLVDGWNDYLIKVLGYSNVEHLKVIEELTIDYAKAFKALDEKYERDREQDKIHYTSKWLDDLVKRFGKDFVCNNRKAILLNLMMAFDRRSARKYDQDAKNIISKELILYLAYERYLRVFKDYYEKLSEKDQKKMNAWKEVAEKYLSITNRSHFAQIYYGRHMRKKIDDNAMQKEYKALYMYFKKADIPFGSWVLSQARQDIDVFIKMCKVQSQKHPENIQNLMSSSIQ
jgi:hypothetical protein